MGHWNWTIFYRFFCSKMSLHGNIFWRYIYIFNLCFCPLLTQCRIKNTCKLFSWLAAKKKGTYTKPKAERRRSASGHPKNKPHHEEIQTGFLINPILSSVISHSPTEIRLSEEIRADLSVWATWLFRDIFRLSQDFWGLLSNHKLITFLEWANSNPVCKELTTHAGVIRFWWSGWSDLELLHPCLVSCKNLFFQANRWWPRLHTTVKHLLTVCFTRK